MTIANFILPPPARTEHDIHGNGVFRAVDVSGRPLLRVLTPDGKTLVNLGIILAQLEAEDLTDRLPKVASLPDCLPPPDDEACEPDGTRPQPLWLVASVDAFLDGLRTQAVEATP